MGLVVAAIALGDLLLETLVLFDGIVEFAEGIAQLEPTGEELETLNVRGSSGLALERGETSTG